MLTTPSEATRTWLENYTAAVDTMDVDAVVRFYAPDARLTYANSEPMVGRSAIGGALGGVFTALAAVRHRIRSLREGDDGLIVFETDVTHVRKDGHEITVPGAGIGVVRDEQFTQLQVYVDLSPVFA